MSETSISPISAIYGGTQTSYLQKSFEAVQLGYLAIQEAREKGADLEQLFPSIINTLAQQRAEIAMAHETKKAHLFGRNRTYTSSNVAHTCLTNQHKPYNDRMIARIQNMLKGKIPLKGDPAKKKFRGQDEYLGRKCTFELELLTVDDLYEKQLNRGSHSQASEVTTYHTQNDYDRMNELDFPCSKNDFDILNDFQGYLHLIMNHYPDVHNHGKLGPVLRWLQNTFPSPEKIFNKDGTFSHLDGDFANLKNIYVLGKANIEIDGKMLPLSEYLTWTYQDFETNPVDRLKRSSIVVIHQNSPLINPTLKEIGNVFKQALQWDKSKDDLQELKNQVGLIRYLFAHAMPYLRGSAAIGEWLEEVIYRDRGFNLQRIEGLSGDLEALIAPVWSRFMKTQYDPTIELSPIEELRVQDSPDLCAKGRTSVNN